MIKNGLDSFWTRVQEEMFLQDIQVKHLAEHARIHESTIIKGIKRNSTPSADIAVRIAKFLNVSVEYLTFGARY